jgi:hypothetical protein
VLRTIQSVKSELIGMFPPGSEGHARLDQGETQSLKSGAGRPHFAIRNFDKITKELGETALPHGFIPFPVYNHGGNTLEKNIDYAGCAYLDSSFNYYLADYNTFLAENAIFSHKMLEPVRIALGMEKDEVD